MAQKKPKSGNTGVVVILILLIFLMFIQFSIYPYTGRVIWSICRWRNKVDTIFYY